MIERDDLCALIPHAGGMCLLDSVEHWDRTSIQCSSDSHQLLRNPLRTHAGLAAVHAIEYGAQAMAVHGGLLARAQGNQLPRGFIAALRDIRLHVDYLHDKPGSLHVRAKALLKNSDAMIYQFQVTAGDMAVADGRITVMTVGKL